MYIASPLGFHAQHAIQALRAGKHVLLEVPAAETVEECWDLVEAVRTTGLTFMMAENYIYSRRFRLVGSAVAAGAFGELVSAGGSYIEDCRRGMLDGSGQVTWAGKRLGLVNAASYPTHPLGPVHTWLAAAGMSTDYVRLVAASTAVRSIPRYAGRRYGAEHPTAADGFWRHGDTVTCLLTTADDF